MSDFANELEKKMAERNFHIKGNINYSVSGKWQRFADGSKQYKRTKDLFVVLHDFDRGATFGDWHYPDDWYTYWNSANGRPSREDLIARQEEAHRRMIDQAYERGKAEWRAQTFWSRFYVEHYMREHPPTFHPYVLRKQIYPHYAKRMRSWLLVPIRNIDYKLVTIQIIKPDSFKRLWKKTSQKQNMIWLSPDLPEDYSGMIRICEGYATGCTIHSITKSPVICAINANNLLDTTLDIRRKFPNAHVKICADNDQWGHENVGLKYADYASRYAGVALHYPVFDGFNCSSKPTDFNDLFIIAGKQTTKQQLITIRR